jgi:DNA polymerase-3 subunit chi
MTKIDFYLVEGDETHFACRLISLIYRKGHQIYVHTHDHDHSKNLDERLWNFSKDSFIPHSLCDHEKDTPVKIGHGDSSPSHQDVLVNLSRNIPEFFSRFDRVAEVVPHIKTDRESARESYSFYKERGYLIDYHEMGRKER